jgi:endoglycosylceramidase
MNVVRLGVLWQAVVPHADGQVNHEYLANVSKLVTMLGEHGIYTLIDMHQDVLGARFCGEGLANWTVGKIMNASGFNTSDPTQRFAAPLATSAAMDIDPVTQYPSRAKCLTHTFSDYYNTFESLAAWDAFFATPGLWDDCGDHWHAVATVFADTPSVLGYELLNEPWGNATILKPTSDKARLLPLYTRLHERIRAADDKHIIFYESHVLNAQYGHSTDFPAGGPGGVQYNDRQAYSYHIYCLDSLPVVHVSCAAAYDIGWRAVDKSRKIVGGGSMLTEFGAVSQSAVDMALIKTMLDPADERMQSWSYWNFKSFDDITTTGDANGGESFYNKDGSVQTEKLRMLTRAYAPIIAGRPTRTHFENRTGEEAFTLEYTVLDSITGSTMIFAQRAMHYSGGVLPGDGLQVTISPSTAASWKYSSNVNMIEVERTGAKAGDTISVVVKRRPTSR